MTIREALQILKPFKECMIDQHGCPISDAAIALDVVIKELENREWIPCSERLPNKDGRYLVCTYWEQDNIEVLRWADGWNCFRDFDGNVYRKSELDRDTIIAWMPLPMALEGEEDG